MNSRAWASFANNSVAARSIYPTAGGATAGARAGAMNPQTDVTTASVEKVTNVGAEIMTNRSGPLGQPLTWWLVLIGALFGLMFLAQRVGEGSEFGNIKASVYNVVIISLAAIVGIGFFKVLFSRFNVPGLSDLVAAV